MKKLAVLFFLFSFFRVSAQNDQINTILQNAKRDSADKKCQSMFYDLYSCYESDEGQLNPKMANASISLFQAKTTPQFPNIQLVELLFGYENAVSDPEAALKWINALDTEYRKVYNESSPLILLFKGETLEQAKRNDEAYAHFRNFLKEYPQSVMALVNVYATETDDKQRKIWLEQLKSKYPNNWAVKNLK